MCAARRQRFRSLVELLSRSTGEVDRWQGLQQRFWTLLVATVSALSTRAARRVELVEKAHVPRLDSCSAPEFCPEAQIFPGLRDDRGNWVEWLYLHLKEARRVGGEVDEDIAND